MSGFDYNSMMALKELIVGEEEADIVQNPYKGSMINPGQIGGDDKKQVAKPNTKIQAKIGEKFQPKNKKDQQKELQNKVNTAKGSVNPQHEIWTQQEVADLPISKHDPRKQPFFQTMYRQKVGTQDVFLGINGSDPSSNHCQQITYKIQLPGSALKDIQIDLNEKQMVIQTKDYYLNQYFQYKTDPKQSKAKFISDKNILELVIPILREDDF